MNPSLKTADDNRALWQALLDGQIVSFDLPIVWYSSEDRLHEIEAPYEANGFPVYDAHTFMVEGGGLKNAD